MTDPSPTDLPRGYQYPHNEAGRPIADPSALTVAMLDKAMSQVREYYDAQIYEIKEGIKLAHEDYVRVPTFLQQAAGEIKELFDVKIDGLKELIDTKIRASMDVREERFHSVEVQLEGRAERARDLDMARSQALDHALGSAKELVSATNNSFDSRLSGLQNSYTTQFGALDEKVNDLRDQLTRLGSVAQGGVDAAARQRNAMGSNSAIVTALIAVLGFSATIGAVILTRPPQIQYVPTPSAIPGPAIPGPAGR